MQRYSWIFCLFALGSFLTPSRCCADHFAIDLVIQSGKESKKAQADGSALATKSKARPVLTAEAGKRIKVSWSVTSTAKKDERKDVLVHLFVVRQARLGDPAVPKLDKDVAAETAMTMDFQPSDKASGEVEFQIERPGPYLVRIETRDSSAAYTQQDFAALDLVIQ